MIDSLLSSFIIRVPTLLAPILEFWRIRDPDAICRTALIDPYFIVFLMTDIVFTLCLVLVGTESYEAPPSQLAY